MRIVMTGATSGIGLAAARGLIEAGAELIVGARRPDLAPADLRRDATLEVLDLADLASARAFAGRVEDGAEVDALVLNAGLQAVSDVRSAQGLEITFATNHLAHFLLIERLAPRLAPNGRVVITSSGTHDPALRTGMPPPLHADAMKLARPQTDPDLDARPGTAGRRAYSASKLCNVMTARALARRLATSRPDIAVAAFDPGFTPGTGLARAYPPPLRFVFRRIMPLLIRGEGVSTPEISGRELARLATDPEFQGARGAYFAVRDKALREVEPSTLARDDEACARLWEQSEALLAEAGVGAPPV